MSGVERRSAGGGEVRVALTERGEHHSRVSARLEVAEPCKREWHDQEQVPPCRCSPPHEHGGSRHAEDQPEDAPNEASSPPAGSDVGNAYPFHTALKLIEAARSSGAGRE